MCSFNKSCVLNTLKQIPQFNKRTEVFTFSTTSMTDFPWCCSSCSSFSWTKGISTKGISRTRKKNSAIKIIGVDLWTKTNTFENIYSKIPWVFSWRFRWVFWRNVWSQRPQSNGLTSLCILICTTRFQGLAKVLLQTWPFSKTQLQQVDLLPM